MEEQSPAQRVLLEEIQTTLDALRADYVGKLPRKLAQLVHVIASAALFPSPHPCLRAHNLYGAVASHGLADLGAVLREIESLLEHSARVTLTAETLSAVHQQMSRAYALLVVLQRQS